MKKGKRYRTDRVRTLLGYIAITLIVAFIALFFCACRSPKTITIERPVILHDTLRDVREVHDSVHVDRWHTEFVKGDTIFVTDSVDRWRKVFVHDTTYQVVERPVEVVTTEVKEVEKDNPLWYRIMFFVGLMTTCLFIAFVLSKILNFDKKK